MGRGQITDCEGIGGLSGLLDLGKECQGNPIIVRPGRILPSRVEITTAALRQKQRALKSPPLPLRPRPYGGNNRR